MDKQQNRTVQPGSQRGKKRLYGLIGGAGLAVAVAFGGSAALPSLTNTAYAQTVVTAATPTATTGTPAANTGNSQRGPKGASGGPGGGRGGMYDGRGVSGTISAISGNTLTLKRGDVVVIQATLNANTVYSMAGKTIALSDLKVGQLASVQETKAADGTVSVTRVEILLNHAGGTISALDATSLTLTKSDNSTVKVSLSAATTYSDLGKAATLAALKAGIKVDVAGTLNADGTLSAAVVNVQHDHLNGTITAINGNAVTVQLDGRGGPGPKGNGPKGNGPTNGNGTSGGTVSPTPATGSTPAATPTTATINLSGSTIYLEAGQPSQLSTLAVGQKIDAVGALSSDRSSLSALQVSIMLPHYQGQVTSLNGSTIVVQDRAGSRTIEVNSSTKYLNGQATAALTDVKAGVNLSAEGKVDASGKMTASVIQLGQPQGPKGPGGH